MQRAGAFAPSRFFAYLGEVLEQKTSAENRCEKHVQKTRAEKHT